MSVPLQLLVCRDLQSLWLSSALSIPLPGNQVVRFAMWCWFMLLKLQSLTPNWQSLTGCLAILDGLEVARHICHQQRSMGAKEAGHLMVTNLKLSVAQEHELNSNLRLEAFFWDYEKQRSFQSQFEYKHKLLEKGPKKM